MTARLERYWWPVTLSLVGLASVLTWWAVRILRST